jgi:hypothetical protein
MTVFHFKKKLPCGKKCHENFSLKVKELVPEFEDGVNGHTTLLHEMPYHRVWVTFYDKEKHENWTIDGIIKTEFNNTQKKFKGKLPTQKQLEKI